MVEFRQDDASKADRQRPRRSWLAPALGISLAAHAGLAAMLWIERPAQPKAGVLLGVEIVSMAGAANAGPPHGGPSPARGAPAKPALAPEASPPPPPDAPRAARAEPQPPPPPRTAPSPPAPETAKPPVDEFALRLPAGAREASPAPAAAAPNRPPHALAAPHAKEIALRKPARIPPPPVAAPRAGERDAARAQTAAEPIAATDAAPGAGRENGATPPRYGFGSAANPIPRYPQLARERGWEGVVVLAVQVGAGGEALSVGIAKSSGHGLLDASAVDAVRRWRFEPARRAGIPIAAVATVPIRFRLEE